MELLRMLLVLGLVCLSMAAAGDHAFLVVHKTASISKPTPSSERIAVSTVIYNVGSTTAYDVSLNDDTWPSEKFHVVGGNTSSSWDKLEAGKSLVHTFYLEPKEKGLFYGAPAVVKYRVAAKSVFQEAYSTPLQELDILSERPPEKKYEWLKKLAIKYSPLVSVISVVALFTLLLVTPSKSTKSKKRKVM